MTMLTSSPPTSAKPSTGGRTPISRILLNNEVIDVKAREMTMDRNMSLHDNVSLAVSSTSLEDTEGIVKRPISFVFGLNPRTEFFYGYVLQVTEEQVDNVNLHFTMKIGGTSVLMQKGQPRFWTNKSIPSVVQDLSYINGHGFSSGGHTHLWKALTQTEESDWKVVTSLTSRIGYVVFNVNGVLLCEDPTRLYHNSGAYVSLISESNLESNERRLLEFKPTLDSDETYQGMGVRFAYLGSNQQVGWAEQKDSSSYHFVSSLPVRSKEEADAYLSASDIAIQKWRQMGTARIAGDASIYPSQCVEIITSTKVKDKKYDGKWLVLGVQHKMDNQTFQTQLTLARPNSTPASQVMPYQPFWEASGLGRPTLWLQDIEDKVRWLSSWADPRAGSVL